MSVNVADQPSSFMIFGLTKRPQYLLEHKIPEHLGCIPRTIDFGSAGTFFFYNSYGDIAETEEAIALKLGFIRSPTMSSLSVQELLLQKVLAPHSIDHQAFRGNALVAAFSKKKPEFSVFKTILSAPQLYYSVVEDGILCATGLKPLISLLDQIEINEDAIVPQFLFGAMLGSATHFRDVFRLFPGEILRWKEGDLSIDLLQDLRFEQDGPSFNHASSQTIDALYERFRDIVRVYIKDIENSGGGFANTLSGGVDSSLLQLIINEITQSRSRSRSLSYVVQVPSFEREINYAQNAISIFNTDHTFVNIIEDEFPHLLIEATQILAQPVLTSAEICKLGLIKALAKRGDAPQYLFSAQGADTLFGMSIDKKIKILEQLKHIPTSTTILTLMGSLLRPFTRQGQTLLNVAETVTHLDNHDHFTGPINMEATISGFTLARRCFGDEAVRRALEDRRNREIRYLDSDHYTEKVHVVELLGDCYEIEQQSAQLSLAFNLQQLYPLLDEDMIRMSMAFQPKIRYIKGYRYKYLLKDVLERKSSSSISRQPKGGSMFHTDLLRWMQSGSLQEMVREITLPGSLTRKEFEALLEKVNTLPWHLLAYDIFKKQVLKN